MSHMEYKEVKIPDEILTKLNEGQAESLGVAGLMDWLNKLAREEKWRMVWSAFTFPYVVLEREVTP